MLLKKIGSPVMICTIYLEVAKQLGITCEPVLSSPYSDEILLRWKEFPG